MKKLTKVGKLALSVVAVVTVTGCLVGYTSYSKAQKLGLATKELKAEKSSYSEAKRALEALRDKNSFFEQTQTTASVDKIVKKINKLTVKDHSQYSDLKKETASLEEEIAKLKTEAKNTQADFKIQESINNLFQSTKKDSKKIVALQGSTVTASLAIVDSVTANSMKEFKEKNYQKAEKLSEWQKAINTLIDEATRQTNQIKTATDKVNSLFDKEAAKADTSRDTYNQAKAEVDKIKNATSKKTLNDKLAKVLVKVDEKEKKEKEVAEAKRVEEQKQAQVAQQQAQTATNNTASANSTVSDNNDYTSGSASASGYQSSNQGTTSNASGTNQNNSGGQQSTPSSGGSNSTTGNQTGTGTGDGGRDTDYGTFDPNGLFN